jgi:FAD/FMN-containing dehydrogenase
MQRKKFMQLAGLSSLGIMLNPFKLIADELIEFTSNEHVLYYKKGDASYEILRTGFNKRIDKYPQIIAQCFDEIGISEAIKLAIKKKMPIAVKSSGHCMEGFSCNNDGMVINLSSINTIEWLDKNTIRVGTACTLSTLYAEILPKGKYLPGGSCAGVAIGGLTLGGGYGLLSRKFGLTCDNLSAVKMVDGNGQIVSSDNNSELLWGCKGGNNGNFGVVSTLTYKLNDAPANMQSFKFRSFKVSTNRAKSLMENWFKISKNLPNDCFSAFVLNQQTVYILLTNTGMLSGALKKSIEQLKSISDKSTQSVQQPLAQALKNYYGRQYPLNFKNASAGLYKDYDTIAGCANEAIDIVRNTPGMIYQINTLGGKIQQSDFDTASSFPHRAFNYFSELQTYWEQPSQQSKLLLRFQEVQDVFFKHGIKAQYRNYPDINFKNWESSYYAQNYLRLKQLKNKYDPNDLFRFEQSVRG